MANIIIRTLEIQNISRQTVIINIKSNPQSLIFRQSGSIHLRPLAIIEVEDNRVDLTQLRSIERAKLIKITRLIRLFQIIIPSETEIGTEIESEPIFILAKFAIGNFNTTYICTDGTLWAWGGSRTVADANGGQIGDNAIMDRSSPVSVVGNHSFINTFGARGIEIGLKQDGSLWTWGVNVNGALGDNTTDNRSSPISVIGTHSFIMAAGTDHLLALKADGTVWGWGWNGSGEIGDNTIDNKSSPISVVGTHSFILISASAALKADGSVWCWGSGFGGQLGQGSVAVNRSSPVSVVGTHSFIMINGASSNGGVIALKSDGTAWGWGDDLSGQLGQGSSTVFRSSPVSVVGTHSFISIKAGAGNTVALKEDGSVWTWGANNLGQLGNNDGVNRSSPVSVVGNHSFVAIDSDGPFVAALKADNSIWTWGRNFNSTPDIGGLLGDNTIINRSSPVSVVGLPCNQPPVPDITSEITDIPDIPDITSVGGTDEPLAKLATGQINVTYLRTIDGTLWAWGGDFAGQLGDNDVADRSSPVSVVGDHSFINTAGATYFSFGLKQDGTLWMWGINNDGSLGDDTLDSRSSPISVVGTHSFIMAAGSLQALALKADGTVWGWGWNGSGEIGDDTAIGKLSPVSVVGTHSFIFISANNSVSLALKADGSAWTWGANYVGTLGNDEAEYYGLLNRSSPVSVVGTHSFIMINGGDASSIAALKLDGSAWTWGDNSFGPLGDNTNNARSSPVSVVGTHSFISIKSGVSSVVALKEDGTVWTWGYNSIGQLGDNTTIEKSSPVSVVGNHSFVAIDAYGPFVAALKADNSVWTWGSNAGGDLGDNSGSSRSSPVSVVGLPF
jgi:alpha-tubulin suppressor-like RCC1 family protein